MDSIGHDSVRKKISFVVPCYNEEDNIKEMAHALTTLASDSLTAYDYEIIFADNCSQDGTRNIIREECARDKRIKAIFNTRNFGQFNSVYHAMCQATGDAVIFFPCDFQDPIELLPEFVKAWEEGHSVVCGIKVTSDENRVMRALRTLYYRLIKKMSSVDQIEHFTGFGLYDKSFVKVLRDLDDPMPYLRGIVAELGPADRKDIEYRQNKRRAGKSHYRLYDLYDEAMLGFTSYTKVGMRLATIVGAFFSVASIVAAFLYLVLKLLNWDMFPGGTVPTLLSVLVLGSVQLLFIGILGEYVVNINTRMMKRPLVIEECRINF